MKQIYFILAIFVFSLPTLSQTSQPTIENLGWMAGCWEMNDKKARTVTNEQWMKPAGGTMFGMSRTVTAGKTKWYEYTRIVSDDKGTFYVARPSGAKEDTFFKMVRSGEKEVVFENLEHDFPQRIIYRSTGKRSLFARIEGMIGGKAEREDFNYVRSRCE